MRLSNRKQLLLFLLPLMLSTGCPPIYSLKSTSIPPNIKTVTIDNFGNLSLNGSAQVSQSFTDALKDRFITQTNLKLVEQSGDIEFKGAIVGYEIRGTAPTADETTALNRLTITVKVDYKNYTEANDAWTRNFSRFADYSSENDLANVEDQLISDINLLLIEDVFNAALGDW